MSVLIPESKYPIKKHNQVDVSGKKVIINGQVIFEYRSNRFYWLDEPISDREFERELIRIVGYHRARKIVRSFILLYR